jgi:peptidoglycan pentaglycine glycine transferase (the first glycine)
MAGHHVAVERGGSSSPTDASGRPRYIIRSSDAAEDPRWDAFLQQVGAHHTQSAAWARVKDDGWQPLRVVVEEDSRIVAGGQLLHRRVGPLGRLGYLSRGPVAHDPESAALVMLALDAASREAGLRSVLIEPDPGIGPALARTAAPTLVPAHFRSSLGATVRLDVREQPEGLLTKMHKKTRYNIRLAQRRGITVRQGDQRDLPDFHRLLVATGRRQGFEPAAEAHYRRWFDILGLSGHLRLFIAERRNEPVSAMLAIGFGDTVVYKRGAWSGEHGELRPNEALHWAAIQWAHGSGYQWYDLDGIDRAPAELVLRGQPVPEHYLSSVTRFKLGFGGEVLLLPDSQLLLRGATSRWLYSRVGARLVRQRRLRRVLTAATRA